MNWRLRFAVAFSLAVAVVPTASGSLTVDVVGDAGNSELFALPGDSITYFVRIKSDAADQIDSAILRLAYSVGGLEYEAGWFEWAMAFENGGLDDLSVPAATDTGIVGPSSFADPFDPGAVDVYFENLTLLGATFDGGALLAITQRIPLDWSGPNQLSVTPFPDTFTSGVSEVQAFAGSALTVTIIPEPTSLLAAAVGVGIVLRRRKA